MTPTYLNPPVHYAVPEFRTMLSALKTSTWRPTFPTLHNTGSPTLAQWMAYGPTPQERWGASLDHYYEGLGWHCFGGEVEFCTRKGVRTFAECAGSTVDVLTPSGYVSAPVKKFGRQDLYRVRMVQVTRRVSGGTTWYSPSSSKPVELRVTRDHTWPLANGRLTRELKVGDIVSDGRYCPDEDSADFISGMRHGFIYGDGWQERGRFLAGIHGRKKEILSYFNDSECRFFPSRAARESTYVCTLSIPSERNLKILPDILSDSADYVSGFVRGWIVADGCVKRGDTYKLSSAKRPPLEWLIDAAPYAGVSVNASKNIVENANGDGAYRPDLFYHTLDVRLSERPWRVESFDFDGSEDVYCAVLPNEDKLFTLANGILTHNSGPHLVVCPDYVWVLCDLTKSGVSVSCWNGETFGIEMVGDYDEGAKDQFDTGEGAKVRDNAAAVLAALAEKFGWGDLGDYQIGVKGLHFHRECVKDHHSCPGTQVKKPDMLARVAAMRGTLGSIATATPVAPSSKAPQAVTLYNAAKAMQVAVQEFQKVAGLAQDGVPGTLTNAVYLRAIG